jgi:hypothetical protein
MSRGKRIVAALTLAAALSLGVAGAAWAEPGPGGSNQCAPGQHDQNNQDPGWKPGACK